MGMDMNAPVVDAWCLSRSAGGSGALLVGSSRMDVSAGAAMKGGPRPDAGAGEGEHVSRPSGDSGEEVISAAGGASGGDGELSRLSGGRLDVNAIEPYDGISRRCGS